MADVGIEQLKEDIQADIKANNNQTITGDLLQERLIDTVDTLKGYTDDHVSVSQNTETGHTDINIGSDSYPVASINDIKKIQNFDVFLSDVLFVNKYYLPHNEFDNLDLEYNSDWFTNINIAKRIMNVDFSLNKIFVDSFIYKKPQEYSIDNLVIRFCKYDSVEGWILEKEETIALLPSMLDETLGTDVYRVPYGKLIDSVPFIRWMCYTTTTDSDNVGYATINDSPYPDYPDNKREIGFGIITLEPANTILKNKRILFFGDSITYQGYYIDSIVSLTGCTAMRYGVSGSNIAAASAGDTSSFEKRVSALPNADDVDIIVMFGGTNDFGHTDSTAVQFGLFTDFTAPEIFSFYAGVHRTFYQLYQKYRGKPIIIMTPLHHGYELDAPEVIFNNNGTITMGTNSVSGKTFKEYVDAIKEVASYYSFDVIDAYAESGLNPCLETPQTRFYFEDGLHPNQVGGLRLAKYMIPLLEKIYSMFN